MIWARPSPPPPPPAIPSPATPPPVTLSPRPVEQVYRTVPLPGNADMDALHGAAYTNGVLHMHVPKKTHVTHDGRRVLKLT